MTSYSQHVNDMKTDQRVKARPEQVQNSAGGFVFEADKWARLDRFLILGSDAPSYYATARELTIKNADSLRACIAENGLRTVQRIVDISHSGRAPKNDPAIFALAMCAGASDMATRHEALHAIPRVCRIGTHLFHFAQDVEGFRRWGRSLRSAVASWYTDRSADSLAMQAIKYQQRDGWAHRDLLRLSHPTPPSAAHGAAFRWMTAGASGLDAPTKKGPAIDRASLPALIQAFEEIHSGVDVKRAVALIREHGLPHEAVPNELKGKPEIWEAMLPSMGLTAILRNLGKMTNVGILKPLSRATGDVSAKLVAVDELRKARIHPMAVLLALTTYRTGHGIKGELTWSPDREIVDALDASFYASFAAVEPTGKSHLLALDVSGSMGTEIGGTNLSCREASAAMAMVTARTESRWHCVGFTAGGPGYAGYGGRWGEAPSTLTPLSISPRQRLDDIVKTTASLPMGGTDCALPMIYAMREKLEVDSFVVYTDNETWHGAIHPFQALREYRQKLGRPAKLVVVAMTVNEFTIADPSDAGMLDVVGFDASAPSIIADFARDPLDGSKSSP